MGGWVKEVTGINESTYDEHRVLYADEESLNPTPEVNVTWHVN